MCQKPARRFNHLEDDKKYHPEGIYFAFFNEFCKIGSTVNFKNRLNTLSGSCPFDMGRVYIIEICSIQHSSKFYDTQSLQGIETYYHRLFERYKVKGEWFEIQEGLLLNILKEDKLNHMHPLIGEVKEV